MISDGNISVLAIRIHPDMPETEALRVGMPLVRMSEDDAEPGHVALPAVLSEIAYANYNKKVSGKLKLYALVYRMLDIMLSPTDKQSNALANGKDKSSGDPVLRERLKTGQRLNAIQNYIAENYRLPITLTDLAKDQFMTPQYLSRLFKKLTGVNFYEYLSQVRLGSAVLDLIGSEETISKIAYQNGFPSAMAFGRLFRNKYGTTPHVYRKESRHRNQAAVAEAESAVAKIAFERVQSYFDTYLKSARTELVKPSMGPGMRIEVDVTKSSPTRFEWDHLINLGFASDLSKANMKAQIEMMQGRMNFTYARFQGIFNEDPSLLSINSSKRSYYNADAIIDYLLSIHLLPFIEIGNKPKKINRRPRFNVFNEEKNYQHLTNGQIEAALQDFLKHSVNRYGLSEVGKWKFEFWAEHDEKLYYDPAYLRTYIETFTRLYRLVKSLVPTAQFGGPGFNMAADLEVLDTILAGLKRQAITPDFVSLYSYPYTLIQSGETTDGHKDSEYSFLWGKHDFVRNLKHVKKRIRQINSGVRHFYVTEWNVDYSNRNYLHDACFKAPFQLQTILDCQGQIDGVGYWLLSDISSEYGDSDSLLYGGAGLINRNGIRKPGFFAFDFLTSLGGHLLHKGDNHIITRHSENEYEVLVFNYKYLNHYALVHPEREKSLRDLDAQLEDQEDLVVSVVLRQVVPGRYSVKQYILNSEHGSCSMNGPRLTRRTTSSKARWSICEVSAYPNARFLMLTAGILMNCGFSVS
jgi:beta-xylosidase/AraC-like DNA-binding protein